MKRTLALILSGHVSWSSGRLRRQEDGRRPDRRKTLVVGTQNFDGKFSPSSIPMTSAADICIGYGLRRSVSRRPRGLCRPSRASRATSVPYNGKFRLYYKGIADRDIAENSDGTVDHNITLKEGVKFSDGEETPSTMSSSLTMSLLGPLMTAFPRCTLPIAVRKPIAAVWTLCRTRSFRPVPTPTPPTTSTPKSNNAIAAFNAAGVKFAQEILTTWSTSGPAPPPTTPSPQAGNWGFDLADDATVEDFWAAIVVIRLRHLRMTASTPRSGTSISSFLEAELGDAYTDYTVAVQRPASPSQRCRYRQDR